MKFFLELRERGLVKDVSNEEAIKKMLETPQTIYCGFDPSATSMHIGNFVPISILMRFQQAGHKVIAVVGGATGMVGDPSGKSKERNLLDEETLATNYKLIKAQLERFIDLSDKTKGEIVNNYDWHGEITYLDFIREYGKYFTVNYMLAKDVVASRMESGISYAEFSYMLLQASDFLNLYRNYDCHLQLGGSDQWGNLTAGLDLIRRVEGPKATAEAFTAPLITKSDGEKFGKSEEGALYLDSELTSPYQLYQYFYNASDEDSIKYLKVFTFLTLEEIEKIALEHEKNKGRRHAQKTLAYEIVKVIHSEEEALQAIKMSEVLFSGKVNELSPKAIEQLFSDAVIDLEGSLNLVDALLEVKAASSKREAREFINGNSIMLNGERVNDLDLEVSKANALHGKYSVIRRGKKRYFLIRHT
ncbi:MAG: tyrosine--tRNA ligase [Erysipelotrichaceae bacterium]|nr:tyrosine--tRNA ligase [Erysipelotrichaceae bacterium]